jgi:hypothetical protein
MALNSVSMPSSATRAAASGVIEVGIAVAVTMEDP